MFRLRLSLLLVFVLFAAACGGGSDTTTSTAEADDQSETAAAADEPDIAGDVDDSDDGDAEQTAPAPEPEPEPEPAPEPVDASNLQERLLDAQPGDVIDIPAGTFSFDRSLSLDVDGVTIRGAGIDDTILSFADQVVGAEGLLVTASDFTIEDLAIEDTIGDALKVNEGENIIIRRVRTEWTGGYSTENGAYGIYPVQTTNVLIEDSVAIGASDAGIYVGQSNNIVMRGNVAEFNVAGIEIENSVGADVYNNVATNNTGGILVFNLPGLSQQGSGTRVYDNDVFANNTENFGHPGTAVAEVPAGSGVLVMANDNVEIFGNRIADNRSANIIVTSSFTIGLGGEDDPEFDGYPEGVYIHDNDLSGGGDDPDSILRVLYLTLYGGEGSLPDIVWDGSLDEAKLVDGAPVDADRICVQEAEGIEVLNADAGNGFAAPGVDTDGTFDCTLTPLDPVELALAS